MTNKMIDYSGVTLNYNATCVLCCRLPVVILTLYNLQLSSTGQLGYYRWKEHICNFIESHWLEFFGNVR